jgi:hypothetical protein
MMVALASAWQSKQNFSENFWLGKLASFCFFMACQQTAAAFTATDPWLGCPGHPCLAGTTTQGV